MSGFWALGADPAETHRQGSFPGPQLPPQARLVLASSNLHKAQEITDILRPLVPGLGDNSIVCADTLGVFAPVEDGVSFTENALIKARAVAEHTSLPVLADDSGLCVDVMNGAPGIFSARWSGEHGADARNLQLLLDQLDQVRDRDRGASFVCAAVLLLPDGRHIVTEGRMGGTLLRAPRGAGGFGYDPIFLAEGHQRSNAELSSAEKNAISHRAQAFRQLAAPLRDLF